MLFAAVRAGHFARKKSVVYVPPVIRTGVRCAVPTLPAPGERRWRCTVIQRRRLSESLRCCAKLKSTYRSAGWPKCCVLPIPRLSAARSGASLA
jgi:hypothetical protein